MLCLFLMEFSNHNLIPYGIDVNEKSIERAKELLPEFKSNFIVKNVNDYDFSEGPFDIIITNPFYARDTIDNFLTKCLSGLNPGVS